MMDEPTMRKRLRIAIVRLWGLYREDPTKWPEPKSTIVETTVVSRTTRPKFIIEEDKS